ncbi:MAG: hypothetical protein Q4F72_10380, partial [Desulfovibrionaceae bacterium]|nr:hypothetical protein [Desulfovibrionaceae bacterium]
KNSRPEMDVELEGLVGVHTIRINKVEFSEDGSRMSVGDYASNTVFLQNALNKFAQTTLDLPDNPYRQTVVDLLKKYL